MTPSRLISIPSNRIRWVCASAAVENVIAATANPAASDARVMNLVTIKPSGCYFAHTVPSFLHSAGTVCAFHTKTRRHGSPTVALHPLVTAMRASVLAWETRMFFHVQKLINEIVPDEPDPAAANALQEGLGGQFGEMRTMMQYMFQSFNARGKATPYKDLIQGVSVEEISHVELIATTINFLLDGSARYQGNGKSQTTTRSAPTPGAGGKTPMEEALRIPNIH